MLTIDQTNVSEFIKNEIYVADVQQKENGLSIMLVSVYDKPYEPSAENKTRFGRNALIADLSNGSVIINKKTAWINPRGAAAEKYATLKEGDNFNDWLVENDLPEQAIVVWEVTESMFATLSEAEQKLFGRTKEGELSAKVNPTTGQVLTFKGEKIYTASVLCEFESAPDDEFVAHDKIAAPAEGSAKKLETRTRARARA